MMPTGWERLQLTHVHGTPLAVAPLRGRSGGPAAWSGPYAVPLREDVVRPQWTMKGKKNTHSLPLSTYSAPGGLRQDPGRAAESSAEAGT
jgi:hypothetical protein